MSATTCIHFVLLCQPHENVRQLEATTGLQRESLQGWDIDTVAAAVTDLNSFASALGYEQLRSYTGGLPLYVESAARVAAEEYKGEIDTLCAELRQQENSTETAQEVILSRVFQGFEPLVQNALALFSLSDVGLSRGEVSEYLARSLNIPSNGASTLIKRCGPPGPLKTMETIR